MEELFEARSPKGKARISEIDGDVLVFENGQLMGEYEAGDAPQVLVPPVSFVPCVRVVSHMPFTDSYAITATHKLVVDEGQSVQAGAVIAEPDADSTGPQGSNGAGEQVPAPVALLARVSGTVRVVDGGIEIDAFETEVRDHQVDATDQRLVRTGDSVVAGQKLTSGVKDPHDILRIEGMEATQGYLVEQVQTVYRNQGVSINDKHIETIISQMMRWVRVDNIGDTELLPNQLIDRSRFQSVNERVIAEGGEPATSKPELRGVTRASLNTDSFLAKASFQETARVLTEAAISGEVDYLRGLKENVIIGRLIPARLDVSAEGRSLLGIPELLPAAEGDSDDFETIMGLMGEVPGMDVFDDEDGPATRAAVDVDFSIDEDDRGGRRRPLRRRMKKTIWTSPRTRRQPLRKKRKRRKRLTIRKSQTTMRISASWWMPTKNSSLKRTKNRSTTSRLPCRGHADRHHSTGVGQRRLGQAKGRLFTRRPFRIARG